MIEPELALFEMVIECRSGHTVKLHQSPFRMRPEGFDSVDVSSAVGDLVLSVVNTMMLFVAQIDQAAVTAPEIGIDHAVRFDSAPNDGQQGLSGAIRQDATAGLEHLSYNLLTYTNLDSVIYNCLL